jgi:hypothetical protein
VFTLGLASVGPACRCVGETGGFGFASAGRQWRAMAGKARLEIANQAIARSSLFGGACTGDTTVYIKADDGEIDYFQGRMRQVDTRRPEAQGMPLHSKVSNMVVP